MKTKIFVSILLLVFLAAVPNAEAQSRKDRKLKRQMAKLEKQMKKVHDLRGNNIFISGNYLHRGWEHDLDQVLELELHGIDEAMEETERVLDRALNYKQFNLGNQEQYLAQAMKARELNHVLERDLPRRIRSYNIKPVEKVKWIQRDAMENQREVFEIQREALENSRVYQRDAMEKAMEEQRKAMEEAKVAQKEAMKEAKMYQQEVIEKLKEELKIAKQELEKEKEKEKEKK